MKCRDLEDGLISAYLDGDLDATTASALRGHLRGCASCRGLAEDHARITGALARLEPAEPSPALWQGVMAGLAAAESRDAGRSWLALRGRSLWARLRPQLLPATALAAAAGLALVWVVRDREGASSSVARVPAAPVTAPVAAAPLAVVPTAPAVEPGPDVEVALAVELERIDDRYATAVTDLIALVAEERARWTPGRQRAYDAELARLRAAVAAAPPAVAPALGDPARPDPDPFRSAELSAERRERRERAWQRLVTFLQRAVLDERIAEVRR